MSTNGSFVKRSVFDSIMFGYFFSVILLVAAGEGQEGLLKLDRNSSVFAACLAAGLALSYFFNKANMMTLGELLFQPAHLKIQKEAPDYLKSVWGWQLNVFLVMTLVVGGAVTRFSLVELLDEDGFAGAIRLFQGLLAPNWDLLPRAIANIIETIFMAFMATTLAIPIAFVLCFFCAKNIMTHPAAFVVYFVLRIFLNVFRSIEALIWAIIFSVWVGIGPFAGMLALMIHSIVSLAKQYSELVESVSDGPIEGVQSTGAGRLQTIWFAIVPQVILPFISFTVYRWDINIRMATIIGLVGGGGIGTLLIMYQGQSMWPEVGTIIVVIAFVVWFMDTASAYIREALK